MSRSAHQVSFWADARTHAGMGHLGRAAALAARLKSRDVTCELVTDVRPSAAMAPLLEVFTTTMVGSLSDATGDALILDDYRVGDDVAPDVDGPIIRVDDGPARSLSADMIVNPNLGAADDGYVPRLGGRVLAGSPYALLRRHVAQSRPKPDLPVRPVVRRVLVTAGAADPVHATERFIDILASVPGIEVRILVGPLNERASTITANVGALGFEVIVGELDIVPHALWADLALTTLGTTAAELACLGVVNLSTAIDARQLPHLERYEHLGVLVALPWHEVLDVEAGVLALRAIADDPGRRQSLRTSAMEAVDGKGADRVAAAVVELL